MAPRAPDGGARNFWTRIASAAVLAPVAIGAIWVGSPWFDLMVIAASAALGWEWARLCRYGRFDRGDWLFVSAVAGVVLLSAVDVPISVTLLLAVALAGAWLFGGLAAGAEAVGWRSAGLLLIALGAVALLTIRSGDGQGLHATIWLFLVTWAVDTGGYLVGRVCGGPKLAPRISPKKTWSGLVGGLLAAIAVGVAYPYGVAATAISAATAALVVAGAAVIGDLLESAAKRRFGLKDSSALIPGHGGLLDRVDGLLLAAPATALMLSESWRWG